MKIVGGIRMKEEKKKSNVGCGCGCLGLIFIILLTIGGITSCTDQNQLDEIKGSEKVLASVKSCEFGPFTKDFYKMPLADEETVFEISLEDTRYEWCGTLIDVKQANGKLYFFVAAYERHFTGQVWDVYKTRYYNRLPYIVRVETDLENVPSFNRGDYISFSGVLDERGINEQGNKQYWQMIDGEDFKMKKVAKKQRLTTYDKKRLKHEKEEQKKLEEKQQLAEKRQKEVEKKQKEIEEEERREENKETEQYKVSVPKPETTNFKNCTELQKVYPDGVSKGHAAYNPNMDRDKDGHACGGN